MWTEWNKLDKNLLYDNGDWGFHHGLRWLFDTSVTRAMIVTDLQSMVRKVQTECMIATWMAAMCGGFKTSRRWVWMGYTVKRGLIVWFLGHPSMGGTETRQGEDNARDHWPFGGSWNSGLGNGTNKAAGLWNQAWNESQRLKKGAGLVCS